MDPIDIQYQLRKRGVTQKSIADELNVSEMTVSKTINKQMVSDRIMRAIASIIGTDHTEVFPEYYSNPPKRKNSKAA